MTMNKFNYVGDRSEKTKNYGKCNNRVSSYIRYSASGVDNSFNNVLHASAAFTGKAISVLRKF